MKNCFDRTPHTMKDWLLLAAGVAAVFAAADWLPGVLRGAGAFLGLLAPFGWGLLLAYVLDIPTRFFAQKLFGGRRGGAMAVSYALFFGALALLAALVVPQLVQSVTTFAGRLGAYEETIRGLLVWVQNTFGIDTATAEQLVQMVGTALQNWFGGLSSSAARAAADFVSGAAGAAGMVVACRLSETLGLCSAETTARLRAVLRACGLPDEPPYPPASLVDTLLLDKKRSGDGITFVFCERPGRCLLRRMPFDELRALTARTFGA